MAESRDPHTSAPPLAADQLKHAARRGISAAALAQAASQLVSLAVLASLYRLVDPIDFGLLGMALPWVMLLRVLATLGLNIAAVQQRELAHEELSALFWVGLAGGAATTLLTVATAPLLAWFFAQRELTAVTAALAATALAAALGMQHQALLERHLRMTSLVWVRLAAQAVAGVTAVALAWAGRGIWALVAQQYAELVVLAGVSWWIEPWRPGWPRRGGDVRRLLKFGGYYTAASLLHFLGQHVDKVLVGRLYGPQWLGLYSQAFTVMMKPIYVLTGPLTGIMLPTLARAQHDAAAYRTLLLSFYRLVAIVCLPVGVGLALVARETMAVLGGENWIAAGPLLEGLALAVVVQGFVNVAGSVLSSVGRADRLFAGAVAMTAALCVGFVVAAGLGRGAAAPALPMAWGYTLVMAGVIFWPYMRFCFATVAVEPSALWQQIRPTFAAAAGMAACVLMCRAALGSWEGAGDGLRLLAMVVVGVVAYAALARGELRWLALQLARLRGASAASE